MANLTSKTMQERDFQKVTTTAKIFKAIGTVITYIFLIVIAFSVLLPAACAYSQVVSP